MKLHKHMKMFVNVFLVSLVERRQTTYTRDELVKIINERVNDKRVVINSQQLAFILKKQDKYHITKTRKHYEINEKTYNNDDDDCNNK